MSKAKRWKPKEGEGYWYIEADLHVSAISYINRFVWDKNRFRLGNCFQTKKEAEAVARKLKGFWKDVREGKL